MVGRRSWFGGVGGRGRRRFGLGRLVVDGEAKVGEATGSGGAHENVARVDVSVRQ